MTDKPTMPPKTKTINMPIISSSLDDLGTPGVWVEVDPATAEEMGLLEETALTEADLEGDGDLDFADQ
ncbi:MAG TPA: hypothetical protein PLO16_15755 [Acidocella sp.]|nr:hypothetical protein [Acidocella sp.]